MKAYVIQGETNCHPWYLMLAPERPHYGNPWTVLNFFCGEEVHAAITDDLAGELTIASMANPEYTGVHRRGDQAVTDQWRIELGPDDHRMRIEKNGELFCHARLVTDDGAIKPLAEVLRSTLDFVQSQATAGDEIVIHVSGVLA